MQEFRVLPQAASGRERTIRVVLWGSIPALVGATIFGVYSALFSSQWVSTTFTYLAITIVVCAIGGAYYAGSVLGMDRVKQKTILVLTDNELIRRREGWPDIKVGFSEIKALYVRKTGLVVESKEPRRAIAVPKEVQGFASLRAELMQHGPILKAPSSYPFALISMIATFACWFSVAFSKDAGVVRVAGFIGLLWGGVCSSYIGWKVRNSSNRLVVWFWLGVSWVGLLWVVYSHIVRL